MYNITAIIHYANPNALHDDQQEKKLLNPKLLPMQAYQFNAKKTSDVINGIMTLRWPRALIPRVQLSQNI